MLMKNLTLFRLPPSADIDIDEMEEALKKRPFQSCDGLDWFQTGFVAAADHQPDLLVFRQRGYALIALKREDKILPAKVIRSHVDREVKAIETKENTKVGKKRRAEIKERITDDLLPKALTKEEITYAYIDTKNRWLVVDATSEKKAGELVSTLREVMPPFPAGLTRTKIGPVSAMTDWLAASDAPGRFVLDSNCVLQDTGEAGALVKISRADLTAEEITQHIATGKSVTSLGLTWHERIRFTLNEKCQLKSIQFLDVLLAEAAEGAEDAIALFESTFTLTTGEISELLAELVTALGGEDNDSASSGDDQADE
ncbi:recombination-associated protein RdgC [Chromobacterium haemolyticum]|uniref:recombination-associated protein RdgC n=1 Tax=Chromobacterium haemolyticum TaxID=394935 RepID=UPI00244A1D38|nr:recombination-associated protein RdgC [Chromobacterium haemolyticum]MDH0342090.1 recombination-associated protein RdgC [Chromobacterium haemolyticum]